MKQLLLIANESIFAMLKTVGGVVLACILLYMVIILGRVLGNRIEVKKHQRYLDKYKEEHGSCDSALSLEEFIRDRAEGKRIVWKKNTQADEPNAAIHDDVNDTTVSLDGTPCEIIMPDSSQEVGADTIDESTATNDTNCYEN